jgi:hypothetical protein
VGGGRVISSSLCDMEVGYLSESESMERSGSISWSKILNMPGYQPVATYCRHSWMSPIWCACQGAQHSIRAPREGAIFCSLLVNRATSAHILLNGCSGHEECPHVAKATNKLAASPAESDRGRYQGSRRFSMHMYRTHHYLRYPSMDYGMRTWRRLP